MKIAVILFNLGGPASLQEVRHFLYRLFADPHILRLPAPLRQITAFLLALARASSSRRSYELLGGASPLRGQTEKQAKALEQELRDVGEVKCFVAMRCGQPDTQTALTVIKKFNPDIIVRLPLYPQYSTTTTASSFDEFDRLIDTNVTVKTVGSYPEEPGFIAALAQNIRGAYREAAAFGLPRVLFVAHGLPLAIVKKGDPYPEQCARTVAALVRTLDMPDLNYTLCYQSKVGPFPWLGPSVEEKIMKAGKARTPVILVPISFVSEHVETRVELDITLKQEALKIGVPHLMRVSTVGTTPAFIEGLAHLVRAASGEKPKENSASKPLSTKYG